ncbi:hypothetical protein [Nonlabens sp.]|uniref:hypothetical protein n=1 Tax=Nonlabens sp. TaxID=1888209 RepID=UPI003F6A0AB4
MKHTKRSFHFAIISSVLLVVFTILSQTTRTVDNNINDITGYLMTLFFVTILMGFFFSILSIKENYHWKKYLGIGINFFLVIMTGIAIAGNLQDIIKVFG